MTQLEQAYYAGFQAKCAEYGINQQETIKLAQAAEQLMSAAPVAAPAAKEEGLGRLAAYLHQLIPGWGPGLYGVDTKEKPTDSSLWEALKSMAATPAGQVAGGAAGAGAGYLAGGKKNPALMIPGAVLGALIGGGEALHATRGD